MNTNSKPLLIGLAGRKQSGKSTVAGILDRAHNFQELSFAAPIRQFTAQLLGINLIELEGKKEVGIDWLDGITPRQIMQRMGTEFGRQQVHPELWVRLAMRRAKALLQYGPWSVVISDVRFENEAAAIREQGGHIVHITRPSQGENTDTHASEVPLQLLPQDWHITNAGTPADLEFEVKRLEYILRHLPENNP